MPEIPSNNMDQNEFKLYPEDDYLVGDGDQSYSDQRYPLQYSHELPLTDTSMNYYEDETNDYDDNDNSIGLKRKLSSNQQLLDNQSNTNNSNLKKRFVWPDSLHKDFISAVFDIGLRYAVAREVSKLLTNTTLPNANQPVVTSETNPTQDQYKSIIQKLRLFRDPRIIPRKSFYEKERDEEELAAFGRGNISNNPNDSNQSTTTSNHKVDPRTLEAKDTNEELIKRTEQEYLTSIHQLHTKLTKIKQLLSIQEKFKASFERNYSEQTKKFSELSRLLSPTMNPSRGPSGLGEVHTLFSQDFSSPTSPSLHNSISNALTSASSALPITDSRELMTEFKGNMEMHHYFMQFREERQQMHGAQLMNNLHHNNNNNNLINTTNNHNTNNNTNNIINNNHVSNSLNTNNESYSTMMSLPVTNEINQNIHESPNNHNNNHNSNMNDIGAMHDNNTLITPNNNNNNITTNNVNNTNNDLHSIHTLTSTMNEWDPDHEDFDNLFCFLYN